MRRNDENEFRREAFSSIYLTMLGIIQAAVFTFLIHESINYAKASYNDPTLLQLLYSMVSDIYMWQVFATLVAMVIITYEYCYFVLLFYRPIAVSDIVILFLIGISEFIIASQVGNSQGWWLGNLVFAIVGMLAFINTLTYNFRELFADDKRRIAIARRHVLLQMIVVSIAAVFTFNVAAKIGDGTISGNVELGVTIIWIVIFGFTMLLGSNSYVQKITQ